MPKREREIEEDREDPKDKDGTDPSLLDDKDLDGEDDGLDNAEARREREREAEERRRKDDAEDREDEDDARLAYSDDEDDDYQPERLSRRKRRNRARKERQRHDEATITALTQELANLRGHVDQVSRGQLGLAATELDGQIAQLQRDLDIIEAAQARAVKEGNDEEFTKARRLEREAVQKLNGLGVQRERLLHFAKQQQPGGGQPQRQPAPDPQAKRYAERFMDRHDWFDPNDASDEDSNIVKSIDATLVNEGYDPGTKRFWVELERRAKARGLGDYGEDQEDGMDADRDDDRQERRERRPARRDALPPRSRGGSGRPSAGAGGFRLTPMMREALEAEGLDDEKNLSDDQRKYRSRLIKTWKDGVQSAERAGARR